MRSVSSASRLTFRAYSKFFLSVERLAFCDFISQRTLKYILMHILHPFLRIKEILTLNMKLIDENRNDSQCFKVNCHFQ